MANNSEQHTGNQELRRQMQSTDAARCQICNFHEGQVIPGQTEKITLSNVELTEGNKSHGTYRICNRCQEGLETQMTNVAALLQMCRQQPVEHAPDDTDLPQTAVPGVGSLEL
jgi:hypothetical protein